VIVVIVLARARAEIVVKLVGLALLGGRYIALTPRLRLGVIVVPLAASVVAVLLELDGTFFEEEEKQQVRQTQERRGQDLLSVMEVC
jgi:hypothetical protein